MRNTEVACHTIDDPWSSVALIGSNRPCNLCCCTISKNDALSCALATVGCPHRHNTTPLAPSPPLHPIEIYVKASLIATPVCLDAVALDNVAATAATAATIATIAAIIAASNSIDAATVDGPAIINIAATIDITAASTIDIAAIIDSQAAFIQFLALLDCKTAAAAATVIAASTALLPAAAFAPSSCLTALEEEASSFALSIVGPFFELSSKALRPSLNLSIGSLMHRPPAFLVALLPY